MFTAGMRIFSFLANFSFFFFFFMTIHDSKLLQTLCGLSRSGVLGSGVRRFQLFSLKEILISGLGPFLSNCKD